MWILAVKSTRCFTNDSIEVENVILILRAICTHEIGKLCVEHQYTFEVENRRLVQYTLSVYVYIHCSLYELLFSSTAFHSNSYFLYQVLLKIAQM